MLIGSRSVGRPSKTIIWKEKERSRIRGLQMDNLRCLLGWIKSRMHGKKGCGVTNEVEERIDEGVLRCFGHVEGRENDIIAKRVYVGECAGSRLVGRLLKRWIDTVKDCLKKRDFDIRQARIMAHDMSEKRGFLRGNALGVARGINT